MGNPLWAPWRMEYLLGQNEKQACFLCEDPTDEAAFRKKLVLLGHSMGSFALQLYLLDHSREIDGAILSGSAALQMATSSAMQEGTRAIVAGH